MIPSDWCAECGHTGAGPRQLCQTCEPLHPIGNDNTQPPLIGEDECPSCGRPECLVFNSDMAGPVSCDGGKHG